MRNLCALRGRCVDTGPNLIGRLRYRQAGRYVVILSPRLLPSGLRIESSTHESYVAVKLVAKHYSALADFAPNGVAIVGSLSCTAVPRRDDSFVSRGR